MSAMEHGEFQLTEASLETPPPGLVVNGHGAMVEFLGMVRGEEGGTAIAALDYEAYGAMALKEGRRLVSETLRNHPILAMQVIHRTGRIAAGEISLRVRVYGRHRKEAFAACEEFIRRLKEDVPIWKHAIPLNPSTR